MAKHAERGGKKKKPKNIGVGIGFKKAKHKVGKKLPQAQNSTDTNFKAKAISLPGQHVGEEKGAAVSERNLTLKVLPPPASSAALSQRLQFVAERKKRGWPVSAEVLLLG